MLINGKEFNKQEIDQLKKKIIQNFGHLSKVAEEVYPVDVDLAFREGNFDKFLDKIDKLNAYLEEIEDLILTLQEKRNGEDA